METNHACVKGAVPGPKSRELLEKWKRFEADKTGFQAPVAIARGDGAILEDVDGNRYLDWTSGVLVTNTGHSHPVVLAKVVEATARVQNIYEYCSEYRVEAAEKLMGIAPGHFDKCFFLSTGSEVTDTATRIMKKVSGNYEIIAFHGAFHGRATSTASLGGLPKFKNGFGPGVPGVLRAPYPYCYRCPFAAKPESCGWQCLEYMEDMLRANSTNSLAGLIVEPYLGTAGFIFPPKGWLPRLEKWARERGILMTIDEVQSGFGRTGPMFAIEEEGLTPDILTMGKGLGGGFTVSAVYMTDGIADKLEPGSLGSTYGGNPVSCAAVSGVIDAFEQDRILEKAAPVAAWLAEAMPKLAEDFAMVGDVRGKGHVWGLELVEDKKSKTPDGRRARQLVQACAERGLLVGLVGASGNVVRVAPPLVISAAQAEESVAIMRDALAAVGG